jgi:two-component system LytT family response regulator
MGEDRVEKIKVLIVDDEPIARKGIRNHLSKETDIEVIGECGNGVEAVSAIQDQNPDIVFLDIQMPELSGLGVIEAIGSDRMPVIVFISAYDVYTLKAFEVHALDYLLKPFETERFQRTLQRAREHLRTKQTSQLSQRLFRLLETLEDKPRTLDRIVVKSSGRVYFIDVDEIDWIEAADNYVRLYVGPKGHLVHESLSSLEKKLDDSRFARVHRSRIVNTTKIKELHPLFHGEYVIVLQSGAKVTSGRSYREKLKELTQNNI